MKEHKFKVWDTRRKLMSAPFTIGDLYGYEGETNAVTLGHPFTSEGQDFTIASHGGGSPAYPQVESWDGINPDLIFLDYIGHRDIKNREIYEGDIIHKDRWGANYNITGEVIWHIAGYAVKVKGLPAPCSFSGNDYENSEIIGNAYVNC
jgi:hypothetical protein